MILEAWQEMAIAMVCMVVLGPAVGNYATSLVYRLPKGQSPFEKHPYCGGCNTFLKPEDLFPIWSYVLLRGQCRYCGMVIPSVYTWVEVLCGILFVGNYLAFGISEAFVVLTTLGVFWITLAALEHQTQRTFWLPLAAIYAAALIYRALADGTIYPAFLSGSVMLILAVGLWKVIFRPASQEAVPLWAWLAMLLAMLLPGAQSMVAVVAMLLAEFMLRWVAEGKRHWAGAACLVYVAWIWLEPLRWLP